jgi:hypothetical protein
LILTFSSTVEMEDTTTIAITLEGFQEPLNVTVSRHISSEEFQSLTSEIIQNYILDLKDKGVIDNSRNDLLIIDRVFGALYKGRLS